MKASVIILAALASIMTLVFISSVVLLQLEVYAISNVVKASLQQQLIALANNFNYAINNNNNSRVLLLPSPTVNIRPNIQADFNPNITSPRISKFVYIDPSALVIDDCEIGKLVMVAPFAVCRGDEGIPIHVGD